ncbi:MAG: tetratricopeptide repeat protein [bacterium]|nr:tetratricopeptide repeat protein [bacterium]
MSAPGSDGPRPAYGALFLFVLTAIAFFGVRANGFVDFDDPDYVQTNEVVSAGLSWKGVVWAFEDAHYANWHPLTWLSHMLDCDLFGLDPSGHHLMNVLVHALTAIVGFLAFRALGAGGWVSLAAMALFAVHPLRVESVAWISERKDTLSGLFFMATLLAYARYVRTPGPRRYALVALALAGGLLSKSVVVTVPAVLILLDFWPLRRIGPELSFPKAVAEKVPLFVLVFVAAAFTFVNQRDAGAMTAGFTLGERIANAPIAYITYLRKALVPHDLAVFYPHPAQLPDVNLVTSGLLHGAALLAATGALVWLGRKRPVLTVGWLWFLGVTFPVIGIIQVGNQGMADRYTYLGLVGPVVAVCAIAWEWAREDEGRRKIATGVAGVAVVACVVLTRGLVTKWVDTETVFTHATEVVANNSRALSKIGIIHENRGELDRARELYEHAIEAHSENSVALNNVGIVHAKQGRLGEAREYFELAATRRPDKGNGHANLGQWHLLYGELDVAIASLERALAVEQAHGDARLNLGKALRKKGDLAAAEKHLAQLLATAPDNAPVLEAYGATIADLGRGREAATFLRRAVQENASSATAAAELAWVLATAREEAVRDGAEALRLATRAAQQTGHTSPLPLRALAAACAETGDFEKAVQWQQKALDLPKVDTDALAAQLQRYRSGQPWRSG